MDELTPEFQAALKQFQCQRCHECCKKPGFVYLKEGEAEEAAKFLGVSDFEFINQYCELEDRRKLVLKKHEDESCIFLQESGCRIHSVKPQQCRDFPVKWRTLESLNYCEGIKKIMP